MSRVARWQNLVVPVGIIACVLVMIAPLPAGLLDVLLAANLAVALVVLLTTLSVKTPLEFGVFPSLLLATTLSRLVLNVASTRLILTQAGTEHLDAAGQVIRAFGEFVSGDHAVVGLILFAIIAVIQFVVITQGATRISEVAARFALDGLPGRQMAIDADLHAGLIDNQEAQRRRHELTDQADFYGAMDGASKFVRGDAVAAMIIILINLVGGLCIGVFDAGLGVREAGGLYSKLTIGDGLVAQLPALLISLGAGLLVTRGSQSVDLPREFLKQLFSRPQVLAVAAGFLVVLVFVHLPAVPLLALAGAFGGSAYLLQRAARRSAARPAATAARPHERPPAAAEKRIEDYLAVDPMEMEIGVGLIRLADPQRGGDLLAQITEVRRRVAADLGIVLPRVRIRDNLGLGKHHYRIKIAGNPVAEGGVHPDRLLAVERDAASGSLTGERAVDPASQRAAVWIEPEHAPQARRQGYQLVEPSVVLSNQLRQVVREHAPDLMTRDAAQHLLNELKKSSPAVVDELIPGLMKLGEVQQVLQMLLREGVPIRPLGSVLEALGDHVSHTRQAVALTEFVRQRLARTICTRYRDVDRRLRVVTIDPAWEEHILSGLHQDDRGAAGASVAADRAAAVRLARPGHGASGPRWPAPCGAGQSGDPRRFETADAGQVAGPGGAELRRNHAGHPSRIRTHRE